MKISGGAALCAAIVVLLTGCVSHPGEIAPSSTAGTPAATEAGPTRPASSFGITCADLVPLSTVASALDGPVDPTPPQSSPDARGPINIAVESAGGLNCRWSASDADSQSRDHAGPELLVGVLPGARESWIAFHPNRVVSNGDNEQDVECHQPGGDSATRTCQASLLVGDAWIEITASGLAGDEGTRTDAQTAELMQPVLDSVSAAIAPVGSSPIAVWPGHPGTVALPDTCDAVLPLDRASGVLDLDLEYSAPREAGYSLTSVAAPLAGQLGCALSVAGADPAVYGGWFSIARGGAWGYDVVHEFAAQDGSAEPATVAGLAASDAFLTCDAQDLPSCVLNLSVGGNWIELELVAVDGGLEPNLDELRSRALALGAEFVASAQR